jgi:acyl dehydratase
MNEDEKLHWEDFQVGETQTYGPKTVTRDEIAEYQREFGLPLPATGGENPVASNWQLPCFFMRMIVDNVLSRATSMGSPGVDYLRWLAPVHAGDSLSVRQETTKKTPHPRRHNLGFVDSRYEVVNQHGQVVMRMASSGMFLLRQPRESA